MKKNLSKDIIMDTTISLLKEKQNLKLLNFREIARTLNCSHVNLYNYYNSFDDLLNEASTLILKRILYELSLKLTQKQNYNDNILLFFVSISKVYLENVGWFRLLWLDNINAKTPLINVNEANNAVKALIEILQSLLTYKNNISYETMHKALHDSHCYIIGEISNYINRRGLINNISALCEYTGITAKLFFYAGIYKDFLNEKL